MSAPKPFNSVTPLLPIALNNNLTSSKQIYGKVILPPDELRCRIAYATDETHSGWKFSCGDGDKAPSSPYKTHRTLREHIRRKDGHAPHDNWGDGIGIASPTEVAAAARLPETSYIITRDDDDNVIRRTRITAASSAQGPLSMGQAPASAPVPRVSISQAQPPPGFSPAQSSPRPGHLPRTRPLYDEVPSHLPRTRPLYDDSDYPGVPREVRRLEHEPVGTYLVRGNYLYLETRNTLGDPTFRLHGIYERIDG